MVFLLSLGYQWFLPFGGTEGSDDFDLLGKWNTDDDFPEAKDQGGSEAYGTHSVPSSKSQAKKPMIIWSNIQEIIFGISVISVRL